MVSLFTFINPRVLLGALALAGFAQSASAMRTLAITVSPSLARVAQNIVKPLNVMRTTQSNPNPNLDELRALVKKAKELEIKAQKALETIEATSPKAANNSSKKIFTPEEIKLLKSCFLGLFGLFAVSECLDMLDNYITGTLLK